MPTARGGRAAAAGRAARSRRGRKSWRLCDNEWTLVSPAGPGVSLTPMERAVLKGMHAHAERLIRRADFAVASLDIPGNGRALDLVISRLKRKGAAAGLSIPIRSLRGKGYSFSAALAQDSAAGDGREPAAPRKRAGPSRRCWPRSKGTGCNSTTSPSSPLRTWRSWAPRRC
ncbi:helix-turn-helix domain-containing protein [Achromobacter xylosoxidans]